MITVLGVSAGFWGLIMALSPLLQIRQMWLRRSSEDVSVGFFAVLLPGFALWIAYGLARSDWALIVPNVVAILVGMTTITVAMLLRRRRSQPAAQPQ
jgi:MtN3 and saliva related transmembrane protein